MENLTEIIEESIELELNAAGIYALFHFAFPNDASFWWQLHLEERKHASLLNSIKNSFIPIDAYPEGLVLPSLQQLRKTNDLLQNLLTVVKEEPPTREEAFHIAIKIETSAGEIHFQKFAEQQHKNEIDKIFCQLVQDDKDHLDRIQQYILDENIKIPAADK